MPRKAKPDLYEGTPCKRGGHTLRIRQSGGCYYCQQEDIKKHKAKVAAQQSPEPELDWKPDPAFSGTCADMMKRAWR